MKRSHKDQKRASGGLQFKQNSVAFLPANYRENKAQCAAIILGRNDRIYLAI